MRLFILLCAAAAFYGAYFFLAWAISAYKKRQYIQEVKRRYEEARTTITYVDYKGEEIPMTVLEKAQIWDNLTSAGKKDALAAWKKHLKNAK